jgi:acyl-CoA synthetase (AMP-forming)/AMP-acid ligase II
LHDIDTAARGTLTEVLSSRAASQADRRAFTFLLDGEREECHLTYGELSRRAKGVAARLQREAAREDRVLLLYPPGIDYIVAFFGCLYAGVVAVPAYPPLPNQRATPLRNVILDSDASIALTTHELVAAARGLLAEVGLESLRWIATNDAESDRDGEWRDPGVADSDLAFLQYSSGSTGEPKGVMLTHANVIHNSALIQAKTASSSDSRGVSWLPPYHDMGLIGGLLQPLYSGFPLVLMSPLAFLKRPFRWLQAISRYQATISPAPSFAYDLCVRKTTAEERATLDLSSWQVALCGAEPVRAETLDAFTAAFEPCGFRREALYPCYGLAEGTLMVSGGAPGEQPVIEHVDAAALEHREVARREPDDRAARPIVGCGRSHPSQIVRIVDPETHAECGPGQIGEIWVSGPSVARGYWNRPADTEDAFAARVSGDSDARFLRTGDVGFLERGELFPVGRIKDVIIVNGRNLYPQDIERTAERTHGGLRRGCGAAFSVETSGEEHPVLVQEVNPKRTPDPEAAVRAIRRAVATEHKAALRAVVLIEPGTLPKTSSGKVRRGEARRRYLDGELAPIAVWHKAGPLDPPRRVVAGEIAQAAV